MSVFRDLSPLLNPKSIAVVGASERPATAGRHALENLRDLGYPGQVYTVHPKHSSVLGYPCFPDLGSLPEPVDLMAVVLGSDKVLEVLKEGHDAGVKAAWVLASGYAESGPQGKKRQEELVGFARESGMLINGPNCVGTANFAERSAAFSVALSPAARAGGVSAVMQSGAICMGLMNSTPFGFRYLISSGNEAVLENADYIGYLASDPQTKVIIAFLEGLRNPEKMISAARTVYEAGKPLLVVKVGRSEAGQRAVQAHTGSLAGSDAVLDSVFQHYGVVRLDDLDQLVEAAKLFLDCPLPESDGVAMVSLSGGQIGLVSDLAENLGLTFPQFSQDTEQAIAEILPPHNAVTNPLDAWGTGILEEMLPGCIAAISEEPGIDFLAVSRDTPQGVARREVDQSLLIIDAVAEFKRKTGKPAVLFSNFSSGFYPEAKEAVEKHGIPYLQGTAETLRAIQAFEWYAGLQRRAAEKETAGCSSPPDLETWRKRLVNMKGATLSEIEGRRLLTAYGIEGPREIVAANAQDAVQAAGQIGYPVVLKILSPDITHKTEIGGVRVGLQDAGEVASSFEEVMAAARLHHPDARLDGVIIQEMIPETAVQVILGIVQDADFGPVVVFGSGGILVELVKDSTLRLPPISPGEARRMISETRGEKLLQGFRGKPPADMDALVDALVRLSQLAVDLGDEVAALDINPLMVLQEGKGVRAVDALVELGDL